ncbi:MAG TPA: hypothetical protein ENO27_03580 [Caldithrix sp.]|nr:hypothetical protein [Caldithrix sp.]
MNHRIEYVTLTTISSDQKFNLNTSFGFNTIRNSIMAIGIIYPLLAWKNDYSILLIDGFKRFEIAKNLGIIELPFILLPSNLCPTEIVKIRYHNIKQEDTELNAHQKLCLYKLIKESGPTADILNKWQKILNISNPEKNQHILNWPKIARDYIYHYNVSIKQLQFFIDQTYQVIEKVFLFATSLSMRIVELSTITELIYEIALNENVSFISILERDQIKTIMLNDDLNRNQKILKLKNLIYEWRFPTITKYQKQINDQLNELSFTNNTIIQYDKSLDRHEIALSTKLKTIEDLNRFTGLLNHDSNKKILHNILTSL